MRASAPRLVLLSVLFLGPGLGCAPKGPQRPPDLDAAHRHIEEQPQDTEGYVELSRLYLRRQDFLRARQYLALAERMRVKDPEALFRLGLVIAVRSGQLDDAILRCHQRLDRKEDPYLRVLLSTILESTGNLAEAELQRQMVIAAHPEDPRQLIEMARFYQRSGRPDGEQRAAQFYRRYLKASPAGAEAAQARAALQAQALSAGPASPESPTIDDASQRTN